MICLTVATAPFGGLAGGWIAEHAGLRATLLVAGLGAILLVPLVALASPLLRLRTLDEAQEPPANGKRRRGAGRIVPRLGRRAGQRDYATVGRNVLDQKFHLVREDLPIGENQVLALFRPRKARKEAPARFVPQSRNHAGRRGGLAAALSGSSSATLSVCRGSWASSSVRRRKSGEAKATSGTSRIAPRPRLAASPQPGMLGDPAAGQAAERRRRHREADHRRRHASEQRIGSPPGAASDS